MRLQAIPIDVITRESFLRYGEPVELHRPDPGRAQRGEDDYRTLGRLASTGWRVSVHCVRARSTDVLNAFDSRRLLTPQTGTALLCVAPPERPEAIEIFVLDRSVLLAPAVPHALVALTLEALVQVSENFNIESRAHPLRRAITAAGVWV
ncbi:MAG: hypothetical protein M3281_09180 [Chloroflexota bacterium]|nr:hypothetical protein [Chloroflexota bacterium]